MKMEYIAERSILLLISVGDSMNTSAILEVIDQEIARLEQVKNLLTRNGAAPVKHEPVAPKPALSFPFGENKATAPKKRHRLSAAGRARIAAAQKARWAKLKGKARK